jgi:mono/diheme cytochrome c family protein
VRHVLVTRASFAISALLVAASLVFAWLAGRRTAAEPARSDREHGERAFASYCRDCHEIGELTEPLATAADPDAAAQSMTTFLEEHGDAAAADDRAIVEFLRDVARGGR